MRTRSFFIVATLVVLLVAAAGGVYAYDSAREHEITKGISVGGVEVGGLKEGAARARLRAAVLEPLNKPVVAHYKDQSFTLTPAQAQRRRRHRRLDRRGAAALAVGLDPRAHVAQPPRPGHQRGHRPRHRLQPPRDQPPRQAHQRARSTARRATPKVNLEAGDVNPTPSATGLAVRAAKLRNQLRHSLLSVEGARSVKVQHEDGRAEGHLQGPRGAVPRRGDRLARLVQALALPQPQVRQVLRDRGRPGRPRDPRGALPRAEQGGQSRLDDAQLRLGGAQGPRQGGPGRDGREPAQGALARASTPAPASTAPTPRARSAPPPRTAASACASRT